MHNSNAFFQETRFILCRPQGGLNDLLCQIEICRRYALETGRVLILDTKKSGLHCDFLDIFESINKDIFSITPEILAMFESEISVHPAEIMHSIGEIKTTFSVAIGNIVVKETCTQITFPKNEPCEARLIVHEQCGGGNLGIEALSHIRLTREIANEVIKRIAPLGEKYDAVHIRHTDYATDYKALLAKLLEGFRARRVLVCSDSNKVKKYAKSLLSGIAEYIEVSQIPELYGIPLHSASNVDRHAANIDILSDLIALSRAQNYYFTSVTKGHPSGFSQLARGLLTRPETIKSMLSNAYPHYLDMLGETHLGSEQQSYTPKSHMIELPPRSISNPGSSLVNRFGRAYSLIKRHIIMILLALFAYYAVLFFYFM